MSTMWHCLALALLLTHVCGKGALARDPSTTADRALLLLTLGQGQPATYDEDLVHSSSRRRLGVGTVNGAANATTDLGAATLSSRSATGTSARPLLQPPSPRAADMPATSAPPPKSEALIFTAGVKPTPSSPCPVCPCTDNASMNDTLLQSPPGIPVESGQLPCPQLPSWTGVSKMQVLVCDLAAPQPDVCGLSMLNGAGMVYEPGQVLAVEYRGLDVAALSRIILSAESYTWSFGLDAPLFGTQIVMLGSGFCTDLDSLNTCLYDVYHGVALHRTCLGCFGLWFTREVGALTSTGLSAGTITRPGDTSFFKAQAFANAPSLLYFFGSLSSEPLSLDYARVARLALYPGGSGAAASLVISGSLPPLPPATGTSGGASEQPPGRGAASPAGQPPAAVAAQGPLGPAPSSGDAAGPTRPACWALVLLAVAAGALLGLA